jgi:hypothetical protein
MLKAKSGGAERSLIKMHTAADDLPFDTVCGEVNHQSYRRSVALIVVFVVVLG